MDDEDFIAAMSEGIPPIAPPDPPEAGAED
jgi:hypothetical protein